MHETIGNFCLALPVSTIRSKLNKNEAKKKKNEHQFEDEEDQMLK